MQEQNIQLEEKGMQLTNDNCMTFESDRNHVKHIEMSSIVKGDVDINSGCRTVDYFGSDKSPITVIDEKTPTGVNQTILDLQKLQNHINGEQKIENVALHLDIREKLGQLLAEQNLQ